MKHFALLSALLLATCAGPAMSPVFGQAAPVVCQPLDAGIAKVSQYQNSVIKGPAVSTWIDLVEGHGVDLGDSNVDFVVIVLIPEQKAALIWFGHDEQLCQAVMAPIDDVNAVLKGA